MFCKLINSFYARLECLNKSFTVTKTTHFFGLIYIIQFDIIFFFTNLNIHVNIGGITKNCNIILAK